MALLFPNTYPLAASNLGYQLVYRLLNDCEHIVCERFVYPSGSEPFRSLESNRLLQDFPFVFASVSFEQDYHRLVAMLVAGGVEPFAEKRGDIVNPEDPFVLFGGVALTINPEPLASFADCIAVGEAEGILPFLVDQIGAYLDEKVMRRENLCRKLSSHPGFYIPSFYTFAYADDGRVLAVTAKDGVPERVPRAVPEIMDLAGRSRLLSPDAELSMYLTELGRGCSRGCRFCAAGFIYRPPRLWDVHAVMRALEDRPEDAKRIGLLGMEMAAEEVLDHVSDYLQQQGCRLSFSSLRADRISDKLLGLLADSKLKSVALAPDGASQRLRRVINKGLTEEDLLRAAERLVAAGITHLKLYVMIGLPTETLDDLAELVAMLGRLRERILPFGRKKGQVAKVTLSINSFVPKPWTPFQYCSYGGQDFIDAKNDSTASGGVMALKEKIKYLRKELAAIANLQMKVDRPERVLEQAVLARGDRRLAPVLLAMAASGPDGYNFKQLMKKNGLRSWEYAVRPREKDELFCWEIIEHGLKKKYLWNEYQKAFAEKSTAPCETAKCRSCGVCSNFSPI